MKRFTFWPLISMLALGCAESAIPSDEDPSGDAVDAPTGENDEDGLDAAAEDATLPRDSGTSRTDGAAPRDDAGRADAAIVDGGLDAGRSDAGTDAGRDAAPQDAAPPDAGPVTCSNGQTTCGNACVDTTSDANHCGGCGNKCASGQTCSANQCTGGGVQFDVPAGCSKKTFNAHGYAFCTSTRSWRDARTACLDANLDLAIVTDKAENDFIKANGDSWIALNDRNGEGSYRQVVPGNRDRTDGANASYFNWRSGEPNNDRTCNGFNIPYVDFCFGQTTDEDCGMVYADGGWNDGACEERRAFVCETY